MSKSVILLLSLAISVCAGTKSENSSGWGLWTVFSCSWEIYLALLIVILGCYFLTTQDKEGMSTGLLGVSSSEMRRIGDGKDVDIILNEASEKNEVLEMELNELQTIRKSLEERSGLLAKEKEEVEGKLMETLEISKMLQEDIAKDRTTSETELVQVHRGGKVRGEMGPLREHALLVEKLETTREEVLRLQESLDQLREERNAVMFMAADIAGRCQGLAGESAGCVRTFVRSELSRRLEMESVLQQTSEICLEEEAGTPAAAAAEVGGAVTGLLQTGAPAVEAESCYVCQQPLQTTPSSQCPRHESNLRLGPVTGSEAFRDFFFASLREE